MFNMTRAGAVAALASTALLAGTPAFADLILETATAGIGGNGAYPVYTDALTGTGDGTDAGSNFIGAAFATGSPITALQVGANVDAFGSGSVFAEIVPLASLASLPDVAGSLISWLQSNNSGDALLTAPATAGDASTVINFATALSPGSYAVVFGSGLYGATGEINLTDGNNPTGSHNIFSSTGGDSFQPIGAQDIRIFASPVPLPAGLPLLGSALVACLAFLRRRGGAPITA